MHECASPQQQQEHGGQENDDLCSGVNDLGLDGC